MNLECFIENYLNIPNNFSYKQSWENKNINEIGKGLCPISGAPTELIKVKRSYEFDLILSKSLASFHNEIFKDSTWLISKNGMYTSKEMDNHTFNNYNVLPSKGLMATLNKMILDGQIQAPYIFFKSGKNPNALISLLRLTVDSRFINFIDAIEGVNKIISLQNIRNGLTLINGKYEMVNSINRSNLTQAELDFLKSIFKFR